MKPPLVSGGLRFSYDYFDLKKVGKPADEVILSESLDPYDWILRVLCFETVNHRTWTEVATKVQTLLVRRATNSRYLAAYFVVAVLLRMPKRAEEIVKMLNVKLNELPMIRDVIDQAEDHGGRRAVVRNIFRQLAKKGVQAKDVEGGLQLLTIDEDELDDLLSLVIDAPSRQDAIDRVKTSLEANGLSLGG